MKVISYYVILLTALFIMIWQSNAAGQSEGTVLNAAVYRFAIDKSIASCDAKAAMRNSRSETIRRMAALSCLKAAYLRNYKEDLVQAMQQNQIGDRHYQIQLFLNQKFFSLIRQPDKNLQEALVDR